MKTVLAWLLVGLTSATSFADQDTRLSRGDLLKNRQYQTNGNLTFYVDPLGADANACTATGTAACLTIQGALNKAPKLLRHQITVNVAAGNYAGFIVSGFTIDPSVQKTTTGILIDGALANVTPATGTATGTASAGSAGSGTTFGTLTDAAQTWTVNDPAIVGRFVNITAGTGSGQIRPIISNTATVLTVAGTWTAPTGTSTYSLQAPSAIVTSTTAAVLNAIGATSVSAAGVQSVDNSNSGVSQTVFLRNIGISVGTSAAINVNGPQGIGMLQVLSTSTGNNVVSGGSTIQLTASSFFGTITASLASTLNLTQSYVVNSTGLAAIQYATLSRGTVATTQASTTSTAGISCTGGATITANGSRANCNSAANSAGISTGNGTVFTSPNAFSGVVISTGLDVTDCTYGIASGANSSVVFSSTTGTFTGNALSYATSASFGGAILIAATAPTITSGTADMFIDNGAATGSFASLAAKFDCLGNITTNSRVCRL